MSGLDVLLAVAGAFVTVLVCAGMILLTPRGQVDLSSDPTDPQGEQLSREHVADRRTAALPSSPRVSHDPKEVEPGAATSR